MTLAGLLKQLRERDVRVWADGDRLRMSAPKGARMTSCMSPLPIPRF